MHSRSGSRLFLLEMIFVLFFFAITGTVCIQLFVRARQIRQETADLNRAVILTESAADAFRSTDGRAAAVGACFPGSFWTEGGAEEILTIPDGDCCLTAVITQASGTSLRKASLVYSRGSSRIYELAVESDKGGSS